MRESGYYNRESSEDREAREYPACLSVVVPVYNEAATLGEVVGKLLRVPCLFEIIIIDDCSTDGTAEAARQLASSHPQVRVIHHDRNSGKTAALRTGFALTTGEIVIVQDADLEYDPADIFGVIEPILAGHADVVFGSRFLVRRAARVLYFYHFLANKFLTFLSNALTNLNMTDVETGYKAFRGDIIRNMVIGSTGFGFEVEVAAKIAKLKVAIYEVPISYYGRTYAEGKKVMLSDGLLAIWLVIRFNLFCSLKASFHQLPNLKYKPNRLPGAALESQERGE
jgi:glycosyltransferase involved in cell wall biosynthesis